MTDNMPKMAESVEIMKRNEGMILTLKWKWMK